MGGRSILLQVMASKEVKNWAAWCLHFDYDTYSGYFCCLLALSFFHSLSFSTSYLTGFAKWRVRICIKHVYHMARGENYSSVFPPPPSLPLLRACPPTFKCQSCIVFDSFRVSLVGVRPFYVEGYLAASYIKAGFSLPGGTWKV